MAKGNFLIESESLTFDLLLLLRRWKESCSVNQFLWCKSIFCSPFWCQIWLQSFLGALLLLLLQSYMNPFLWAIWPYAEAFAATTTTVAIASFFSHWEKHSQCNAFFNLGNLTLCTTRLQNLDGFWKFLKEAKNEIKSSSSQRIITKPSFYRRRRRGRFTRFLQLGSTEAAHFAGSFREDWKNASKMPKNPS